MAAPRIVVVGSTNTDLTVVTDRLPAPGETVLGGELVQAGGGKGANQAVAAARAGAQVALVAKVGDDAFGRVAQDRLRAEGIDTTGVTVAPQAASGVALIMVDHRGENLIAVASGANALLAPADVEAARPAIEAADVLLVQLEVPMDAVMAAVRTAKSVGTAVLVDPAPVPAGGMPEDLLRLADYVTPNMGEAARLTGVGESEEPEALARALIEAGVRCAFITLGAQGVWVSDGTQSWRVSPPSVDAVDTVGAGDCFSGTVAVAVAEGMAPREAARFATCAAALSVQEKGAQPSLPRRDAIEQIFREHI